MSDAHPARLTALADAIATQIEQARIQLRQAVNSAMVHSYWHIGCLIVEDEQQGAQRAEYGKQQLLQLSTVFTQRLGKGFDVGNLRNMRQFYLSFPIRDAVRSELSWTHYRSLMRIENLTARDWYLNEAISQNWSAGARALYRYVGLVISPVETQHLASPFCLQHFMLMIRRAKLEWARFGDAKYCVSTVVANTYIKITGLAW